jgi:Spy/CpxP family protein refolding chaperone
MKNKITALVFMFAILLSLTTMAQGQKQRLERQQKLEQYADNDHHRFPAAKLLTEDQKEAIKSIRMESMKEAKTFRDLLRELKAHHQTLMTAETADMKAIYKSLDKQGELQTELSKIRAKSRIEIQSLLTEEQKLEMQSLKEKHRHLMRDRRMKDKS